MIGLASITAPMTEKVALDHVARMLVRNLRCQLIQLKLTQTGVRAVRIDLLQQLFPGQRDVVLAEPSTRDRKLPASNDAEPQCEWGGSSQKGTTASLGSKQIQNHLAVEAGCALVGNKSHLTHQE